MKDIFNSYIGKELLRFVIEHNKKVKDKVKAEVKEIKSKILAKRLIDIRGLKKDDIVDKMLEQKQFFKDIKMRPIKSEEEDQENLDKLQQGTRGQRIRSKGKFDIASKQFEEQLSPFIKDGQFDEAAFQENRRQEQLGIKKFGEQKAERAEQRKDSLTGLEVDLGFAGGGIAKEGGVESGVAPESGPTPDGPEGLFSALKYVKKP